MSLTALTAERRLAVRRHPLLYPPLELLRGVLVGLLWPVPFVSSSVEWRGERYRIGRRTLLVPRHAALPELTAEPVAPTAGP